jgi:hypothetical protein
MAGKLLGIHADAVIVSVRPARSTLMRMPASSGSASAGSDKARKRLRSIASAALAASSRRKISRSE